MLKKISSLAVALCISLLVIPTNAQSINQSDIITQKNMGQVMKMYGLDITKARKVYNTKEVKPLTVKQLETAIKTLKSIDGKKFIKVNNHKPERKPGYGTNTANYYEDPHYGTIELEAKSDLCSAFDLIDSCDGHYVRYPKSGEKGWTGVDNSDCIVDGSNIPGTDYEIIDKDVDEDYTYNLITVESDVEVQGLIEVNIPYTPFHYDVPISTTGVESVSTWDRDCIVY
jgi:hypothetical protein